MTVREALPIHPQDSPIRRDAARSNMLPVMMFPGFDPVLVQVGPFAIRWYALAYIVGLVLGWRLMRRLVRLDPAVASVEQVDDFLTWATLGVVLGGRLGYVLFYQPSFFLAHPGAIIQVWHGGMSFHGGMLGVVVATILFCHRNRISFLGFADRLVVCVPLGLMLGRIANFINGELWGRAAPDWLPWAMIFPSGGPVPRHPSQLYEAGLEGALLFIVMLLLVSRSGVRARFGQLGGSFLIGYSMARIISEHFREPDSFLGFLTFGLTMGQILCLPMAMAGLWLVLRARTSAPATGRTDIRSIQ
ncbi:Prolipoprotein diacylglyceryl transferase [Granulibacter bethesdensis]|nr:Prolipoprotein diacylglyceryl transferase [Granulibacter bethesdensis]